MTLKPLPSSFHGAKVVRDLGIINRGTYRKRYCEIQCPKCDGVRTVQVNDARRGWVRCRDCTKTAHGLSGTRIHKCWGHMRSRCQNPSDTSYSYYGGRGISVCHEWNDVATFHSWALANGYQDDLTIDRIDNEGDYEPSNCRWVTRSVQARNTRRLRSNNTSGYRGVSWNKKTAQWTAKIYFDGKQLHLGCFDTAADAAIEYDAVLIGEGLEGPTNFKRGPY